MFDFGFQILFMGGHLCWSKVAEAILDAPNGCVRIHRAQLLTETMYCLDEGAWDALLIDLSRPSLQGMEALKQVHSRHADLPIIALVPRVDAELRRRLREAGAAEYLELNEFTPDGLQRAIFVAIGSAGDSRNPANGQPLGAAVGSGDAVRLQKETPKRAQNSWTQISHALNNLLCVISGNAEILADYMVGSHPAVRNVMHIQKASKEAAKLVRQFLPPGSTMRFFSDEWKERTNATSNATSLLSREYQNPKLRRP